MQLPIVSQFLYFRHQYLLHKHASPYFNSIMTINHKIYDQKKYKKGVKHCKITDILTRFSDYTILCANDISA